MRSALNTKRRHRTNLTAGRNGSARTALLVLVCFVLGFAVSAWWFHEPAKETAAAPTETAIALSDGTKSVIGHLSQSLEIRFYSLLDPNAPTSLRAFSDHVGRLLSAYEQEAGGKIRITRYDSPTNANPNAALADGINGFNLDKGEGCFLGLVLACNGKKETLPQLAPEWESALEADISRAVLRLSETAPQANPALSVFKNDAATVEAVKERIPNFASVSPEEGTRTLRETGLKEFTTAVNEMKTEMQDAQQRLEQARAGGSAAELELAMKHLQEVQRMQSDKLREVAARSQALITAFQQLKAEGK